MMDPAFLSMQAPISKSQLCILYLAPSSEKECALSFSRILLQPSTLYSTNSSVAWCYFTVSAQLITSAMNVTVGKPFSSPLAVFFLIPAPLNSSSTVIIILKSHSGHPPAQRKGTVYQKTQTDRDRAEISVQEEIAEAPHALRG